ncbi:hypothetical protein Mapa_016776 [Marchantia paleacea]|nr:hypothetical protein Mapa_016776 [Marchantia paleacea]
MLSHVISSCSYISRLSPTPTQSTRSNLLFHHFFDFTKHKVRDQSNSPHHFSCIFHDTTTATTDLVSMDLCNLALI